MAQKEFALLAGLIQATTLRWAPADASSPGRLGSPACLAASTKPNGRH
jgi:hypothetical protein